jgi:hypothetical protein
LASLLDNSQELTPAAGRKLLSKVLALIVAPPGQPVPRPRTIADFPEELRLVLVLNLFHFVARTSGVAAFMETAEVGAYVREAQRWCQEVGAEGAATYLREAAALFPRSRLPKGQAARVKAVRRLTARASDALAALDDRYRGTLDEIPQLLCEYLRTHREWLEGWLTKTTSSSATGESAQSSEVDSFFAGRAPRSRAARQMFMSGLEELVNASLDCRRLISDAFDPTLNERQRATNRAKVPEIIQMIVTLHALWSDVERDGIAKFLELGGGELAHAQRWCSRLDAKDTAAYLRAVGRLFPGGDVPVDRQERDAAVNELMSRWPDPLQKLDQKYRGAVDEIPARLHAHLRKHRDSLNQWLQAKYTEARRGPSSTRGGNTERPAVSKRKEDATPKPAPPPRRGRLSARKRREVVQRADRFLEDLEALSPKQWGTIWDVYHKAVGKARSARGVVESIRGAIGLAKTMKPIGRTMKEWDEANRELRARAGKIADALPAKIKVKGKQIPLRQDIFVIATCATHAVLVYEELLESEEGRNAAEVLLAPFDGFITPP